MSDQSVDYVEASATDLLAAVRQQKLEGIIGKRKDNSNESGKRTGAWIKHRLNTGQELVIGGYVPGTSGLDCIVVGYYADCHLFDFEGFGRVRGRDRWKYLRRAAGQLQSAQDATHAGFVRRLIRTVIRYGFPSKGLAIILLTNNRYIE
jgi:ATP-dependent DNA ligase